MKTIKANKTSPGPSAAAAYAMLVATAMLAARSAAAQRVHVLTVARLPRVYNALIASEQDLLPSQAHPIVRHVPIPVFYGGWPYATANARPAIATNPSRSFVEVVEVANPLPADGRVAMAAVGGGDADVGGAGVAGGGHGSPPRGQPRPAVKNNRPADSAVPDVPPPPLPVSAGRADKKKPEEYPPAPGAFAI